MGKALAAFLPAAQRERALPGLVFQPVTRRTIRNSAEFQKELLKIHRRGYALDNEESVPGARCVAAPIVNARNEAVAAISVSGPVARITNDKIPMFATAIKKAVRTIAEQMGFTGQPPGRVRAGRNEGRRAGDY
ncbi:MAG TPA: IclR family transcriptional regulator C-terminal domain-containing protein [Candidatus Acidoferrum sp.]|nr:IclR family transcriptional regulator C-terminal domain-containing protein [Candidatus Acidoferrum sp.]